MESLELELQRGGRAVIILMKGRLDGNSSSQFNAFLSEKLGESDTALVLDMTSLDFVSSAGLRELVVVARRLGKAGAKAVLCGMKPMVNESFEISGLSAHFQRADNQVSAIRMACQEGGASGFMGRVFS